MTDPVADLIIQIKNAYLARRQEVRLPSSRLRAEIARLLVEHGYLSQSQITEQKPQNELVLQLRYVGEQPALSQVVRVSKPGRRVYVKADALPRVLGGHGLAVVSTSRGLMTAQEARRANVGGEVLFTIW